MAKETALTNLREKAEELVDSPMIFMLYQELIDNAQEWGLFDVETSLWEQVEDTSTTEKVPEKKAKTRTAKPQLSKT